MRYLPFVLVTSLLSFAAFAGCQSDDTTTSGSGAGGDDSGAGSPDAVSNSSSSGMGGGSTTGAMGGAGGTGGTVGVASGGAGGGTGGGATGDHLLISELAVSPGPAEFVEIYNPTAAAVDLTDYYLSDNSTYVDIATGKAWTPITTNPGSDFLAQFPPGASIAAGAAIVIATSPGFEMNYAKCPDYIIAIADVTCANGTAKAMVAPATGGIDDATVAGTLFSNDREMVILFTWDGNTANPLKDVDYLTWGAAFENGTRVDKTGVAGYQPDTAPAMQKPALAPGNAQSIERCGPSLENGETPSGGNGITGHDETSEALDMSFKLQAAPTPGVKNACL